MWFAFNFWIPDIRNNDGLIKRYKLQVVICFQFLNTWYSEQHIKKRLDTNLVVICFQFLNTWYSEQLKLIMKKLTKSCDLLSISEYLIFGTTMQFFKVSYLSLWFAFNFWIPDIRNNTKNHEHNYYRVVICFQFLNTWYSEQHNSLHYI